MIYKKILLKELTNLQVGSDSFVEIYLNDKNPELHIEPRLPMIIVPGGAYRFCSHREAEPVALRYMSEGFNCFVLHYSCSVSYPLPHIELAFLIDCIKKNSVEFNIDSKHISVLGFSAGGHLISSFSLLHKEFEEQLNFGKNYLKPFSLILCYPVTLMTAETLSDTKLVITNGCDPVLINKLSVPENLTSDYPPTYIWSTKADVCVPLEHSFKMVEALKKNNVFYKYTLFENGVHGGSLCNHVVYDKDFNFKEIEPNRIWVQESVEFVYNLLDKEN